MGFEQPALHETNYLLPLLPIVMSLSINHTLATCVQKIAAARSQGNLLI
jgi:hypothetical protein